MAVGVNNKGVKMGVLALGYSWWEQRRERARSRERVKRLLQWWIMAVRGGAWCQWEMELGVSGHSCLGRLKRENEQGKEKTKRATAWSGNDGEEWTWKGFANIWIFVCDWIEKWKKILSFSFLDSFYFHSCDIFLFFLMWNFEVIKMVSWYFLMLFKKF